ncbi:TPA: hypothetical protein I7791_05730 [Vibrio vulnificus]|nr:hypothetical protein [Vibrio vulnificus]
MLKYIYNGISFRLAKCIISLRDIYYKQKNRNKAKVFVFTDSRGFEVTKPWNRRNPYSSYIGNIIRNYSTDYYICPEHSTTIIDFLFQYKQNLASGKKYDKVIAHIGIVDFSPRPITMIDEIMKAKRYKYDQLEIPIEKMEAYQNIPFDEKYYDMPTKNIYNIDFFKKYILDELSKIDNLIIIGCHEVDLNWRGNYWRDRPSNINIVLDYNAEFVNIGTFIDLSNWNLSEVRRYTVDNVHLNKDGFSYISKQLTGVLVS